MFKFLRMREDLISIYKKNELLILFVLKFFIGYFVLKKIFEFDMFNENIKNYIKPTTIVLISVLFGVFFNLMPISISYTFIIFIVTLSISKSLEVSFIVFIALILILFFYVRIATKESIFIMITIFAFYFRLPYIVPIITGVYFGLTTIIPVSIGIFIWRSFDIIKVIIDENISEITKLTDILTIPNKIINMLEILSTNVLSNQTWIFEALIFSMIIILVFFVSRLSFDYSKEVAIILGGMLNIIGFLIAVIVSDIDIPILSIIIMTIVSVFLAFVYRFFDNVVDYRRSERVEFEDEDNYYYVKTIPKIKSENVPK